MDRRRFPGRRRPGGSRGGDRGSGPHRGMRRRERENFRGGGHDVMGSSSSTRSIPSPDGARRERDENRDMPRIIGILRPRREETPEEEDGGLESPQRRLFQGGSSQPSLQITLTEEGGLPREEEVPSGDGDFSVSKGTGTAHSLGKPTAILVKRSAAGGDAVPSSPSAGQAGSSGTGGGILHVKLDGSNVLTASSRFHQMRMDKPVKLIEQHTDDFVEGVLPVLDSNSSPFLVVAVCGPQGVGKSTLLNALACSPDRPVSFSNPPFKVRQSLSHVTTDGVDVFVTHDRLILLDTAPLLSLSLADSLIEEAHKSAHEAGGTDLILSRHSLQILAFLMMVSNIIIFVQDESFNLPSLKLLRDAAHFKPFASHVPGVSPGNPIPEENNPHLVFVHNRLSAGFLCPHQTLETLSQVYTRLFSPLNDFPLLLSSGFNMADLLPLLESPTESNGNSLAKSDLTNNAAVSPPEESKLMNIYLAPSFSGPCTKTDESGEHTSKPVSRGRGSHCFFTTYDDVVRLLSVQIRSLMRPKLSYFTAEDVWLSYAARVWSTIQKDSIVFDEFCKETGESEHSQF